MGPDEQKRRMVSMRQSLKENNIYAWAASLIEDLSKVRLSDQSHKPFRKV